MDLTDRIFELAAVGLDLESFFRSVKWSYRLLKLGERFIEIFVFALVLPREAAVPPDVGPPLASAGLFSAALENKRAVVAAAVTRHKPEAADPLDLLRRLGGLEFAAMAGAILAARMGRVPVVLDGFCSGAAAGSSPSSMSVRE